MLATVEKKPKCFAHLFDYESFECYEKKKLYAYLAIEFVGKLCSFHLCVVRWSHNVLKEMKKDFFLVRKYCRKRGCKIMVVSNGDIENHRFKKLISFFGFPSPRSILVSTLEV